MSARPPGWVSGRAEHYPDLLPNLIREQAHGLRPVEVAGELAQRLRHQPRLEADRLLAHLPLELDARRQRRDRVDGDDVDRAGAHKHVDDLERLLAVVGLRDQQLVGVDTDPLRVDRVERMLGVDERADATARLSLGDDVVDERGLAGGLRAEDLDDPPAGDAANAKRQVERQRARGDRVDRHSRLVAQLHHRAGTEVLVDLAEGGGERRILGLGFLRSLCVGRLQVRLLCFCHSFNHLSRPLVAGGSWRAARRS